LTEESPIRRPHSALTVLGVVLVLDGLQAGGAKAAKAAARPNGDMMKQYLLREVETAAQRWEADFEARTTSEQIAAWQKQSREHPELRPEAPQPPHSSGG
jgi:hypothetical protein